MFNHYFVFKVNSISLVKILQFNNKLNTYFNVKNYHNILFSKKRSTCLNSPFTVMPNLIFKRKLKKKVGICWWVNVELIMKSIVKIIIVLINKIFYCSIKIIIYFYLLNVILLPFLLQVTTLITQLLHCPLNLKCPQKI